MKKYTLILILLLSMLALAACKEEEKTPADDGQIINDVVQKDEVVNEGNTETENGDDSTSEYYELPILTVVKDGNSRVMKENESALIYDLTDDIEWIQGVPESFESDYVMMDNMEVLFEFDSKTNTLNKKNSDIYIKLHNELAIVLLLALNGEL